MSLADAYDIEELKAQVHALETIVEALRASNVSLADTIRSLNKQIANEKRAADRLAEKNEELEKKVRTLYAEGYLGAERGIAILKRMGMDAVHAGILEAKFKEEADQDLADYHRQMAAYDRTRMFDIGKD